MDELLLVFLGHEALILAIVLRWYKAVLVIALLWLVKVRSVSIKAGLWFLEPKSKAVYYGYFSSFSCTISQSNTIISVLSLFNWTPFSHIQLCICSKHCHSLLGCSHLVGESDVSVYHLCNYGYQHYSVEFGLNAAYREWTEEVQELIPGGFSTCQSHSIRFITASGDKVTLAF